MTKWVHTRRSKQRCKFVMLTISTKRNCIQNHLSLNSLYSFLLARLSGGCKQARMGIEVIMLPFWGMSDLCHCPGGLHSPMSLIFTRDREPTLWSACGGLWSVLHTLERFRESMADQAYMLTGELGHSEYAGALVICYLVTL